MVLKFAFLFATFAILASGHPTRFNLVHLGDIEGKSFYADTTPMTWIESFQNCYQNGMQLAKIESEIQASFLVGVLGNARYWISVNDARGGGDALLDWDTIGVHITSRIVWTEDGDASNSSQCGFFRNNFGNYYVDITDCFIRGPATLCEDEIVNSSIHSEVKGRREEEADSQEWIHLGDIEMKGFYTLNNSKSSWEDAFDLCLKANMSLAWIESQIQADFIGERVEVLNPYYIALKDVDAVATDVSFNGTGAYTQLHYNWTDDGRVGGERSFCGAYLYCDNCGTMFKALITIELLCFEQANFLCSKKLE